MIIKTFEISKKKFNDQNFFLVYGDNEGLKNYLDFGYSVFQQTPIKQKKFYLFMCT